MQKTPVRLQKDPIIEAVFELRFQSANQALSDLLPGMLFIDLKEQFPTIGRMPISELPREVQEQTPDLRYQPRYQLAGEEFVLLLGDHSLVVSSPRPYAGWGSFRAIILKVLTLLDNTKLISVIERYSLKYVNLLEAEDLKSQFAAINLSAQMGKYPLTDYPSQFKAEITEENFVNLIEIIPNTKVKTNKSERLQGLLLSVDTIQNNPKDFWKNVGALIDQAHNTEKRFFFGILTEETIEKFGPILEQINASNSA